MEQTPADARGLCGACACCRVGIDGAGVKWYGLMCWWPCSHGLCMVGSGCCQPSQTTDLAGAPERDSATAESREQTTAIYSAIAA
eukprot:scaffold6748_cov122-Isochrysis_galbana.AAC.10